MTAGRSAAARSLTRRTLLGSGVGLAAAGMLAGLTACSSRRAPLNTVGSVPFATPLAIPPLATSVDDRGVRVFDLELRAGRTALAPGGMAETWGVNGAFLGPTIRVARGESVRMDVRNSLPETSSLHWHGMHLPAIADGGPRQPVEPGATWSPTWTVDQEAATLWYHPHPHGQTEHHAYRGIAGLLLVDDEHEAGLPLPRRYGVDDIPLIVQDKTFAADGALIEGERTDSGLLGDTILVNGTRAPVLTITSERTRLRVLNASTARSYSIGFDDDRVFAVIAGDGGLLDAPVELSRLLLTPGERAELVVTLAPAEHLMLRSFAHDLGLSERATADAGAADELDLLALRASATLDPSPELPARLAGPRSRPSRHPVAARRELALRNDRINGEKMDASRVDAAVTLETTEIWTVVNDDNAPHNFHVHGTQFEVLDVGGSPPPPELGGLKDTVYVPPDVEVRLALRFTGHSDPSTPYMFHCHLLQHEDRGMMGQFVVLGPGEQRVELPAIPEGHEH